MRILAVEDEPILARQLKRSLERESYAVDLAESWGAARDLEIGAEYDLILLSLGLPDGCGLDLLRLWRREELPTPVLILSARTLPRHRVAGLDAGADDYLVKPFAWRELGARVRCLLRRRRREPVATLVCDDLVLDRTRRQACRGGLPIDLTARELALLEHLMLQRGRAASRTAIAEHVWDGAYEARSNTIDVLIARLRRKLEAGGRRRLIVTVRGLGYALRGSDAAAGRSSRGWPGPRPSTRAPARHRGPNRRAWGTG